MVISFSWSRSDKPSSAMMRAIAALFAGCVMWLCNAEVCTGQNEDLKKRFLEESPSGWKVLQEWDSKLDCAGILTAKGVTRDGKTVEQDPLSIAYRRNEQSLQVEIRNLKPGKGDIELFCINPNYSFWLKKRQGGDWTLAGGVQKPDAPAILEQVFGYQWWCNPSMNLAWVVRPHPLSGFYRADDFKVLDAKLLPDGDIKVHASAVPQMMDMNQEEKKAYTFWMTLSPGNHWALVEAQNANDGNKSHTKVSFQNALLGKVRPFTKVTCVKSGPGGSLTEEFVYTKVEQNDLPDEVFTLTAFGLPEPHGVVWDKPTKWWLWITMAGVGSAALAFLFVKVRRRYLTRLNPSPSQS